LVDSVDLRISGAGVPGGKVLFGIDAGGNGVEQVSDEGVPATITTGQTGRHS
jgi:hypothetical protein